MTIEDIQEFRPHLAACGDDGFVPLTILTSAYERFVAEAAIPSESQKPWPVYCALGLAGEAGEVVEQVKKTLRQEGGDFTKRREAIRKELGDVLWYVTALAASLGFTLEDVIEANVRKLVARRRQGTIAGDGSDREVRS